MAGNDGNSPEKLTVNSVLGFEKQRSTIWRIFCYLVNQNQRLDFSTTQQIPATGANTPVADFLALIKTTSPLLIQTTVYCTSLQELAANRYHPVDASQNITVQSPLALSAEFTCLPALYDFVITQILLAEPLGSLSFKMVQVIQLRDKRKVEAETAGW
ncbi:hypothetical protein F511_38027 [Dorcoceras hygrometricum]|uniref:Uncharacterized protein n=1 Tax=Dorcoceras hygrometricum TaxID=472368 RepID=A0A2Z7AJ02_9LAMI|nr:hypothetical protein F511_38027 [Dorcoceras hygrometricum]